MRSGPWTLAAVAALTLAAPAVASAKLPVHGKIVEGVGMGGVKLGMTEHQVRVKWGKTSGPCVTSASSKLHICYFQRGQGLKNISTFVGLKHNRVVYMYLSSGPHWKTKRGAGLGTKYSRLKKLYPKAKFSQTCVLDRGYVAEVGKRSGVTSFRFNDRKGAKQGITGVQTLVIYNAKKIDWDAIGPGVPKRPPNRPTCPPRRF